MDDKYQRPDQDGQNLPEAQDVDELLQDVRSLLADETAEPEADEPDTQLEAEPEDEAEPSEPVRAEDVQIDYGKFYAHAPQEPLTFYEQSKPAYQRARRAEYERIREQERQERAQRQQAFERKRAAQAKHGKKSNRRQRQPDMNEEAYAQWLYTQGLSAEEQAARAGQEARLARESAGRRPAGRNRPKRRKGWRVAVVLALLLALLVGLFHFVLAQQPETESVQTRKKDCATILVAGTDEGGYRTDSMLLVNLNRKDRSISLVSIPRDTLIFCEYSVPKINSAYGWAGGGEAGMQELLLRVSEIIGFEPDGYVVVDLQVFEELVDLMGGVKFDVPVDMHYEDASQGLKIDLQAGQQRLTGEQAMQVARFRSGYATADLKRIEVQRELVSAAIDQWVSLRGLLRLSKAVTLVLEKTHTDLEKSNLLWLAESFLLCSGNIRSQTLPGSAVNFTSGSYYVLDAQKVVQTVNDFLNPYEQEVQTSQLYIRTG